MRAGGRQLAWNRRRVSRPECEDTTMSRIGVCIVPALTLTGIAGGDDDTER